MTTTRADVRLLEALASLAAHSPERMRARHLAPQAERLARRLAESITPDDPAHT